MNFQQAAFRYHEWASSQPGIPNRPSEARSREWDGVWHLHNVNGPLAVVLDDGSVYGVGHFWDAYERLAEEGKCDSPGGAEYRRVLLEWIEDSPDNMEEFIVQRANVGPYESEEEATGMATKRLAEQLQNYIRCRAAVEGVGFDLSLEFFEGTVMIGAKVFGVVHDGHRMLYDEQEPYYGFFEQTVVEITEE